MTKRHKQRQRQQRSTWAMNKNEFNKGDRVYVSFDIVDYVIKDGNSHGELNGKFEGYGVLDRVEDGRVYGRRDDGLPFSCMVSDVTKIEPNTNKSGVCVITPSGESYVRAWDLASKDDESILKSSNEMNKYQVWLEGFSVTGQQQGAQLVGEIEAKDFVTAVTEVLKREKWGLSSFRITDGHPTYWGCRFFDNEADARKLEKTWMDQPLASKDGEG